MTSIDILDRLLIYSSLNVKSFSEKIGKKRPQSLYDIQTGKTKGFSDSLISQIISVFPEINTIWLKTGEGEMLKNEGGNNVISGDNSQIIGSNIGGNGNKIGNICVDIEKITAAHERTIADKEEIITLLKERVAELKENKTLLQDNNALQKQIIAQNQRDIEELKEQCAHLLNKLTMEK